MGRFRQFAGWLSSRSACPTVEAVSKVSSTPKTGQLLGVLPATSMVAMRRSG
jgi:hypothetical protein